MSLLCGNNVIIIIIIIVVMCFGRKLICRIPTQEYSETILPTGNHSIAHPL